LQQVFKEANEKVWKIIKYLSPISTTIWQRYQCVRFKYLQILKSNISEDIWPKYESDCCASPIHHSAKRLDFGQPVNRYILVDWLQYITITIYQDIVIWIHQPSWLIDLGWMMGADCLTRPDWTRWWLAWEKDLKKSVLKFKHMRTWPQATAKLYYDVSYWFLSTTRICVWKENTISIVPTNIFWVFFTLLFNPNHPNLDPQYSHPISSAKTSAKCQVMTKTFWNI